MASRAISLISSFYIAGVSDFRLVLLLPLLLPADAVLLRKPLNVCTVCMRASDGLT